MISKSVKTKFSLELAASLLQTQSTSTQTTNSKPQNPPQAQKSEKPKPKPKSVKSQPNKITTVPQTKPNKSSTLKQRKLPGWLPKSKTQTKSTSKSTQTPPQDVHECGYVFLRGEKKGTKCTSTSTASNADGTKWACLKHKSFLEKPDKPAKPAKPVKSTPQPKPQTTTDQSDANQHPAIIINKLLKKCICVPWRGISVWKLVLLV
jgi:hypothetical protein